MAADVDSSKKSLSREPDRSFELPGGPYAKYLGEYQAKILAEFKRGSEEDEGYGPRR